MEHNGNGKKGKLLDESEKENDPILPNIQNILRDSKLEVRDSKREVDPSYFDTGSAGSSGANTPRSEPITPTNSPGKYGVLHPSPARSGSTIVGRVVSNRSSIVDMSEKRGGEVEIYISAERVPTFFGSSQKDHVTAYVVYPQILNNLMKGVKVKEIPEKINELGRILLPGEWQNMEVNSLSWDRNKIEEDIDALIFSQELNTNNEIEEYRAVMRDGLRVKIRRNICEMSQRFMEILNSQRYATFPKPELQVENHESNKSGDTSHNIDVKRANAVLRMFNDMMVINRKRLENKDCKNDIENFYDDYMTVGAPYKIGFNKFFKDDLRVKRLFNDWGSLADDQRVGIIVGLMNGIENQENHIVGSMGDLYDFQFDKHKDEDSGVFLYVTARHIVLMFHSFPELRSHSSEIIKSFIQDVVLSSGNKGQGWGRHADLQGLSVDNLISYLSNYADLSDFSIKNHDFVVDRSRVRRGLSNVGGTGASKEEHMLDINNERDVKLLHNRCNPDEMRRYYNDCPNILRAFISSNYDFMERWMDNSKKRGGFEKLTDDVKNVIERTMDGALKAKQREQNLLRN